MKRKNAKQVEVLASYLRENQPMNPIEHKTSTHRFLFVESFPWAKKFNIIHEGTRLAFWGNMGGYERVDLPKGNWQILGMSDKLSEEQMEKCVGVLQENELGNIHPDFRSNSDRISLGTRNLQYSFARLKKCLNITTPNWVVLIKEK